MDNLYPNNLKVTRGHENVTSKEIIVVTTEEIPGKKVKQVLGIVRGNTVRARNIGRDIGAGFKNIIGGEIKTYTDMISESREEAL